MFNCDLNRSIHLVVDGRQCLPDFLSSPWWWKHKVCQTLSSSLPRPAAKTKGNEISLKYVLHEIAIFIYLDFNYRKFDLYHREMMMIPRHQNITTPYVLTLWGKFTMNELIALLICMHFLYTPFTIETMQIRQQSKHTHKMNTKYSLSRGNCFLFTEMYPDNGWKTVSGQTFSNSSTISA